MISSKTQEFINKRWPDIKDNQILHQQVKERLMQKAYIWSRPEDASEKLLDKAKKKAKSLRFVANGFGFIAGLTLINEIREAGPIIAYADTILWLIVAFSFYYEYREMLNLIKCYNEIECESSGEYVKTTESP
jgi:hypothetical protein